MELIFSIVETPIFQGQANSPCYMITQEEWIPIRQSTIFLIDIWRSKLLFFIFVNL